jgi:hypothetical protein
VAPFDSRTKAAPASCSRRFSANGSIRGGSGIVEEEEGGGGGAG